MVTRTVNMGSEEPEQRKFELPSEKEHLFQVVDIIENPDPDIVITKLEVAEGDELDRSLLHRVSLDSEWKGFFLTRLFLKAVGEQHKGDDVVIDSDNWIGRSFHATVIHNKSKDGEKTYANINEYNFDKAVDQVKLSKLKQDTGHSEPKEVEWDADK